MSSAEVTRTEQADTVTYTATIVGVAAATLVIRTSTREVVNVETIRRYQRQGLASTLWAAANAGGECFHSLEHHRTPEGDMFAHAVGGETIDAETGYVAACSICTDDIDHEE